MLKSEYLENRSLSTTIVVNDNILPFANYLPDIITERSERKRLSPSHDLAVERLYLDSSFTWSQAKTVLNGEAADSEVHALYTENYDQGDRTFSVYGEIDREESDFYINSLAMVEHGSLQEARELYRKQAFPVEKIKVKSL